MSKETILDELVSRYQELKRQGQAASPEEVCAEHPELVDDLKARLKAHAAMKAFLSADGGNTPGPTSEPSADERGRGQEGRDTSGHDGAYPAVPGYEIEDVLGRGGMGVVYRARDVRLNREVAVKFLRDDGPANSGAVARFTAEAQITGQLQHPGIPAVHELGTLPDGQPFLAMKLVKGQTLAALLHERTDPSQRRGHFLAIFEQICQAVGYAHAHRVIHRDLKPGNVMVGAFGEVQVMDWGLAKVLPASRERERPEADPEGELPETMPPVTAIETPPGGGSATRTGQVMGTPAYMAPEQAGGEVRRLDARSDVFGLGAILCQVLTGRPPYQGMGANDVRLQAVRGDLDDALARLDACGAEPDLVAMAKRCLAFRQEDRPADGGSVAAEVARLRAAAEERARQAEFERAEALVREAEQRKRRRVWFGLAASLLVGVIAASALALWANHSRQQAELATAAEMQAKETAQTREAETKAVLDFVENRVFAAARPKGQEGGLGPDVSLRKALENALQFVEKHFSDQPLIEARLRLTLGTSFLRLGEAELAHQQHRRSLDLRRAKLGPDHPDTLQSMNNLAMSWAALGRHADALQLREETLALLKAKLGPDHPDTLAGRNNLARSYAVLGRHADALKLGEETLALQKAKLGPDHPDTLGSMHNLAISYGALGRHAEALQLTEETLTLQRAKLGPDHPNTLQSMVGLVARYSALGRHADALRLGKETLALRKGKLGPDHPNTLQSLNNLASSFISLRQGEEAVKLVREALDHWQKQATQPDNVQAQMFLAWTQGLLGWAEEARQQFAAAAQAFSQAVERFDELDQAGKLREAFFRGERDEMRLRLAICRKAEQAIVDLDYALQQPPAEVPGLLDARLRVLLHKKDRAGMAATAAAWQQLGTKDAEQCYAAAAAWSLASQLAADEKERGEDAAKALALLKKALEAKKPSPTPLLLAWRLEQDPDFAPLRSQPAFAAFVKELHAAGEGRETPKP